MSEHTESLVGPDLIDRLVNHMSRWSTATLCDMHMHEQFYASNTVRAARTILIRRRVIL